MTTALAIAQATVDRAAQSYYRGGMSYCQQFAGNFWETFFGRSTPNSYASAAAAYRASSIVSTNPETAPPGAYHYFTYGTLGHVGVALGSGLMASGTGRSSGAVANLGKNVFVHRVATYGLPYLGWSYTNGARAQITGLTDHQAPVVLPNQRQVKANADSRRREAPTTGVPGTTVPQWRADNYDPAENLKAGKVYTIDGYVVSALTGGSPAGGNVWFKIGSLYSHSSGFTNAGVAGLMNLGTIEPPKPIVMRTVTIAYKNLTNDSKQITVEDGKLIEAPMPPEDDKFNFVGWFVGDKLYDFGKPVTSDFTLEAQWVLKPVPVDPTPEPTPDPVEPDPTDPGPEPTDPTDPTPVDPKPQPQNGIGALIGAIVVVIAGALAAWFGWGQ